ncbi:unnamed protein product [Laminaria digitata]
MNNVTSEQGVIAQGMVAQGMPAPAASVNIKAGAVSGQSVFSSAGTAAEQAFAATVPSPNVQPVGVPGQVANPSPNLQPVGVPGQAASNSSGDAGQQPNDNDGNADALRAALDAIVMENRVIDDVEEDVKRVCRKHGVVLSVSRSLRTPDKTRKAVVVLKCRHGMANRQAYWQARRYVPGKVRRRTTSKRSGCPFEIHLRHPANQPHPRFTVMKLGHTHEVDPEATAVELRLKAPLTAETKAQVEKMAASGMKPKAITDALSTLHDQPINLRAVQNASAAAAARAKASAQEVNKLYADLSKNLNEINSILLDSVPPALARDLVQSWLLTARMLAKSSWGG